MKKQELMGLEYWIVQLISNLKVINIVLKCHLFIFVLLVTDLMKRESAIVEDVWRDLLKPMEEKRK